MLMGYCHSAGFPGVSLIKNSPANAEYECLILWSGRSPGEGNGNPLKYTLAWEIRQYNDCHIDLQNCTVDIKDDIKTLYINDFT